MRSAYLLSKSGVLLPPVALVRNCTAAQIINKVKKNLVNRVHIYRIRS